MSTLAEVQLWGRVIGAVALNDGDDVVAFEYDPAFIQSGIEVSPLTMPLAKKIYTFPELSRQSFHGLPGLLADSLPDKFGNALINAWLATQGRAPNSFNAVERLCYTGRRGMGALEFQPSVGPNATQVESLQVEELIRLASAVLSQQKEARQQESQQKEIKQQETQRQATIVAMTGENKNQALQHILQVGTSAGGARAKAVVAWNPATNEICSGQIDAGEGFEYWLIKFDGVSGNKDKELEDPQGYGQIEYAYYLMARDAGIDMHECRLLEENGRHHFMTRRFDRSSDGKKIHMQSLGALAHFDFNMAGAYSYEQALLVMRQLQLPMAALVQLFRRMVFNIVGRNQDDHVKNIAFLMDRRGKWSLAPAFDMTYAFQPTGLWTSRHQMSLNGRRDDFTIEDFKTCAKTFSFKRGLAEKIVQEVVAVVSRWREYADQAGVSKAQRDGIRAALRLGF